MIDFSLRIEESIVKNIAYVLRMVRLVPVITMPLFYSNEM